MGAAPTLAAVKPARARTVEALRAAYLRGGQDPRRVARAESLALLIEATHVLYEWTCRAAAAHDAYVAASVSEEERAWPVGPFFEVSSDGRRRALSAEEVCARRRIRRRPLPRAETWRALERSAAARASEAEWYAIVVSLIEGTPLERPRPREVVIYGNDGKARVLFTREERRDEDEL